MTDRPLTLKIMGKLAYEDEITLVQAAQIIEYLNSNADAPRLTVPTSAGTHLAPAGGGQGGTPRAALDDSGAKTNPQKIVALAAWVLRDGGETFEVEAVKAQFQRARESLPKNLSRDLGTAIAAGWIAESDMSGEYYVTQKGHDALTEGFPLDSSGGGKKKTGTRSSNGATRKSSEAKGKKPDAFASIDVFRTVMDGVEPYHRMPAQKDKLLWALHFAQENNVRGLTNAEAAWLTNELGDGISSKHLGTRFGQLRRNDYANRSTTDQKMRITPDGVAYLKSIKSSKS